MHEITVRWDRIPRELLDIPHWVAWRYTLRDGKPDKPPISIYTGLPVDATKASNWLDSATLKAYTGQHPWCGAGFQVEGTDLCGIDLDDVIVDGEIAGWVKRYLIDFNSYAEITPSQTGVRIWIRATLPPGNRRKKPIEFYDSGRYFTVTGDRIDHVDGETISADVESRQDVLDRVYRDVFPAPARSAASSNPVKTVFNSSNLNEQDLLRRAFNSREGTKIESLFNGSWEGLGYPSKSEADCALCWHLGFWFGYDHEQVNRVFRQSGLYDDKWEREDYRTRTMAKAFEGRTAAYDPDYHAPKILATVAVASDPGIATNGAIPRVMADGTPPREPGDDPEDARDGRDAPLTDAGNAIRFVNAYGNNIHWVDGWKKWLIWDDKYWKLDDTLEHERMAIDIARSIHEIEAYHHVHNDEKFKKVYSWGLTSEAYTHLTAIHKIARSKEPIPVIPSQLNNHPYLFNCLNGTIDLRTGMLGPHIRDDLLTQMCKLNYDPNAKCPLWEQFLLLILSGDMSLIKYIQQICGISLSGSISEQILPILYGSGENGKSTFYSGVSGVLGNDYAMQAPPKLLVARNRDSHPTQLAALHGKRLVVSVETQEDEGLDESTVKALTGGEPVTARRMREDFWTFTPTHKVWLITNHEPDIKGVDHAIWRRIKKIPFNVRIDPGIKDIRFADKLKGEYEGILAWMVRGCLDWLAAGQLVTPPSVEIATREYRESQDAYGRFFAETCLTGEGFKEAATDLWTAYNAWAGQNGEERTSNTKFGNIMRKRGLVKYKNSGNFYRGIMLKYEFRIADSGHEDYGKRADSDY